MQINSTEWLDHTASLYPEKTAIVDGNVSLSFSDYRKKALALARRIVVSDYGQQEPIVVYMEKSAKVLVSFMGIAYSRNFYIPLDVDMPTARINKILEILQPGVVITTAEGKSSFCKFKFDGNFIIYEEVNSSEQDERIVKPVSNAILDTDLVYVLFTSGSTGTPKGVGIRHRSLIDYIDWVTEEFDVSCDDAFCSQAPFYFDNSILDIYATMKTGATLHIVSRELFSKPVDLMQYLKEKRVNSIFWVPTELIMVARIKGLKKIDMSDTLKRVLFCGEVMPNKELNIWRKHLPNTLFSNLYGPTEITDACTFYHVDREFADEEPLPIGKPMRNTEVFVIGENNRRIVPEEIGKIGELCVKGTCLAAGYYKNPQKTKEVFVQNPFNNRYEEIIYRTGDLVSYNEYGELMYHGRRDFQIKHLGHRIELGEIETAVSSFDEIDRNCCIYDYKHTQIVLFYSSNREICREDIRRRLSVLVPEYMLPEKIIRLDEMPVNANGKIDRIRLKKLL